MPSSIAFLPYVRRGLATGIKRHEGESRWGRSSCNDSAEAFAHARPNPQASTGYAEAPAGDRGQYVP
jgi:hypothetical protein